MAEIICKDTYGNPLEYLTQWDKNQAVIIEGVDLAPCPSVRFSNKASNVSLVVRPTIVDGSMRADIPNILLQQPYSITFNVLYEHDDGSSKAAHIFTVPVIPSKKPDDYQFTQNVDYVSWLEVAERAEALLVELENIYDDLIVVSNSQPADFDILWFDTSETGV